MPAYQILVDTWEGHPYLEPLVLKAAGVAGILIRLNDMNGGHYLDTNFAVQWPLAAGFARFPYFVYNPWVSGKENLTWLATHIPQDCSRVAIDIEVRYSEITPAQYATQVASFIAGAKTCWKVVIYTGQWFLSYLESWPKDVEYWWAQYPYSLYPAVKTPITWPELSAKLAATPFTSGYLCPGPLKLWQCTADRYILPGCGPSPIDINVWPGTLEELQSWVGGAPVPVVSWQHSIDAWARTKGYTGPEPD
jgi:GH25 family lysozyme M1 (1,4-beta-N-acetylmuramidase)